jgi:hypothetical protein
VTPTPRHRGEGRRDSPALRQLRLHPPHTHNIKPHEAPLPPLSAPSVQGEGYRWQSRLAAGQEAPCSHNPPPQMHSRWHMTLPLVS